jgi:hypothetical protein
MTREELLHKEMTTAPMKLVLGAGKLSFPLLSCTNANGDLGVHIGIRELEKAKTVGESVMRGEKGNINISILAINKEGLAILKDCIEAAMEAFDEFEKNKKGESNHE